MTAEAEIRKKYGLCDESSLRVALLIIVQVEIEMPRECDVSEADIILLGDGAARAEKSGRVGLLLLSVNPGALNKY